MLRFVLLRHEPGPASARVLHWDLMLEEEAGLRTWALEAEPARGSSVAAVQLPVHRKAYLDYEGPVSGQRGAVTRLDAGTYSILRESCDELLIELDGARLQGSMTLQRCGADQRWLVSFDDG